MEADGVVLDSVDCHNSATTAKSTNDSEEFVRKVNSLLVRIQVCQNVMMIVLVSLSVLKRMVMISMMKSVVLWMI